MKKLLLLFAAVFLFSCSGDDAESTNNPPNEVDTINPPEWVQGTWLMQGGGLGLRFSTDDVCMINGSTLSCNRENIIGFNNAGGYTNVEETISNDSYTVEVAINSIVNYYHVTKVSATEIKWHLNPSSPTILIKQ